MIYELRIQGGSDISRTLSKLHRRIKINFFTNYLIIKLSQLYVEAETKTYRHIPAKINQQEATKPVIVSRLRAGGVQ